MGALGGERLATSNCLTVEVLWSRSESESRDLEPGDATASLKRTRGGPGFQEMREQIVIGMDLVKRTELRLPTPYDFSALESRRSHVFCFCYVQPEVCSKRPAQSKSKQSQSKVCHCTSSHSTDLCFQSATVSFLRNVILLSNKRTQTSPPCLTSETLSVQGFQVGSASVRSLDCCAQRRSRCRTSTLDWSDLQ